jgi:cyclopropane fatty-acyl-phospholipid synthase-like methyltransferase
VSYHYIGSELELFAAATNWKAYLAELLRRFVAGRVLEVGAGIGSNVSYLHNNLVREWTCLEPDPNLARRIEERLASGQLPTSCRMITGTTASIDGSAQFDTILYLDVLEHILEDCAELNRARRHLAAKGNLVVVAPAHQFLFTAFDAAIGHHRRYNRAGLRALTPHGCLLTTCLMLDCAGLFDSLANKALLSAALPSKRQIACWDKLLVPVSRVLDRVIGNSFGKTIVAVWRHDD